MGLNTWPFLVFAILAIISVRSLTSETLRRVAILIFSVVFLGTYITTAQTIYILSAILNFIWVLGRPEVRRVIGWSGRMAVGAIVVMWAGLFILKNPTLMASMTTVSAAPVAIIGISYMVFRGISYLIEAEDSPAASFLDFLNYMLFFPTLLAGPIERFREFTAHYATPSTGPDDILPAFHRIANGYIKKFILADNLAVFGIAAVADPTATPIAFLWFATAIQLALIYLDFSGYCDIAIGIGSLMGVKLRENFAKPFTATNIQEFWDRWHISMSSLMRDYIFTPICKVIYTAAQPKWQWPLVVLTYCCLMMLIALWHGTSTGFMIFGLVHGAVLVAIQVRQKRRKRGLPRMEGLERLGWQLATYLFVSFTMVLWMRPGTTWIDYYRAMFGGIL